MKHQIAVLKNETCEVCVEFDDVTCRFTANRQVTEDGITDSIVQTFTSDDRESIMTMALAALEFAYRVHQS